VSKRKKKKTRVGYYCPACQQDGFAPDEMTVTRDGLTRCIGCAWEKR
jgi:predicted SprT family Zn-dependent metalloprotease